MVHRRWRSSFLDWDSFEKYPGNFHRLWNVHRVRPIHCRHRVERNTIRAQAHTGG